MGNTPTVIATIREFNSGYASYTTFRFTSYRDAAIWAINRIIGMRKLCTVPYWKQFDAFMCRENLTEAIEAFCKGTNGKVEISFAYDMLFDEGNPTLDDVMKKLGKVSV